MSHATHLSLSPKAQCNPRVHQKSTIILTFIKHLDLDPPQSAQMASPFFIPKEKEPRKYTHISQMMAHPLSVREIVIFSVCAVITKLLSQWRQKELPSPHLAYTESIAHTEKEPSPKVQRPKPRLEPPSMMSIVYGLYKSSISANHQKMICCKMNIDALEIQRAKIRDEKIKQFNEQMKAKKSASDWSTAMMVFSWISTCLEIFSGIALILSGNVIPGCLLLMGGVVQLTNHVMQQTGGWDAVAEALPGDNPDQKRKIITWMQIGTGIFSMMLAGSGGVMLGMTGLSPAMQTANTLSTSGLAIGTGIVQIGSAISASKLKKCQSELQSFSTNLEKLDHKQKKIREDFESTIKFDKQCAQIMVQAIRKQTQFIKLLLSKDR